MVTCEYDCTDWACEIMATCLSVCELDGLIRVYLHGDLAAGYTESKHLLNERVILYNIHMIVCRPIIFNNQVQ